MKKHSKELLIALAGFILFGILISFFIGGNSNSQGEVPPAAQIIVTTAQPTSEYDAELVRNYEIISLEDISQPTNLRMRYRVVVPSDISKSEFKSTIIQLIIDETVKNQNIDEIAVLVYDREEDTASGFTLGMVLWNPTGGWGELTQEIASSNNRNSYVYDFNILEKVGNRNNEDKPTERELEIYGVYVKAVFEEFDTPEEEIRERIAEEFGITEEELDRIWLKVFTY